MSQVLLYTENSNQFFDSLKELFISLSESGEIVTEVENGEIKTDKNSYKFAELKTENTKEDLINTVEDYRVELRASVALIQKQGINLSKTELTKLGKQFNFLKDLTPQNEEQKDSDTSEENSASTETPVEEN